MISYFLTPGSTLWFITFAISQVMHCAGIGHAYGIVGDTVDVGEYKSGVRVDGFISSFVSLMMKAGGAVGPAILIAWMGAAGYVANVAQTATVQNVMNIGMNLITGLCCLLIVIFNLFFDLTPEKHEKIRLELERRRAE